jgi:RNA polymerase sigma-70 factor (ECF subfamily)
VPLASSRTDTADATSHVSASPGNASTIVFLVGMVSVSMWVFAIAAHVLARHWRRSQRRARCEVLVDVLPAEQTRAACPSRTEVRQALAQLPGCQRQALALLGLAALPIEVAATRAGTTVGALRVRAHRASKMLRMLLFG